MALLFQDSESVDKIIETNEIETELVSRFPLEMMYKDKNNFISLLFYMGMLTIKGESENKTILTIPNYVIKTIYLEYMQAYIKSYAPDAEAQERIVPEGFKKVLLTFIGKNKIVVN